MIKPGQNLLERSRSKISPDHRFNVGIPCEHRSVAMEHGNGRTWPERDGFEEALEVGGRYVSRNDAKKLSVRSHHFARDDRRPSRCVAAVDWRQPHAWRPIIRCEILEIAVIRDVDGSNRPGL